MRRGGEGRGGKRERGTKGRGNRGAETRWEMIDGKGEWERGVNRIVTERKREREESYLD